MQAIWIALCTEIHGLRDVHVQAQRVPYTQATSQNAKLFTCQHVKNVLPPGTDYPTWGRHTGSTKAFNRLNPSQPQSGSYRMHHGRHGNSISKQGRLEWCSQQAKSDHSDTTTKHCIAMNACVQWKSNLGINVIPRCYLNKLPPKIPKRTHNIKKESNASTFLSRWIDNGFNQ